MATKRNGPQVQDVPADYVADAVPPTSFGHRDHSFTLQAVMELQKSVGEMQASLVSMKGSVDSVKSKVDDLVGWKNRILGGAATLGIICAVLGFAIGKLSDYVTFRAPVTQAATLPQPTPSAGPHPSK